DFGLAKALGDDTLDEVSGTLAYMAPEQARGDRERIDARTDLFGLGAVLYYLLTGEPPYRAGTVWELHQLAGAGDVVPARERNRRLPRAWTALCRRGRAKARSGRSRRAAELAGSIRRWQRRRRRRWPLAAATLLVLLGGAAVLARTLLPPLFSDREADRAVT